MIRKIVHTPLKLGLTICLAYFVHLSDASAQVSGVERGDKNITTLSDWEALSTITRLDGSLTINTQEKINLYNTPLQTITGSLTISKTNYTTLNKAFPHLESVGNKLTIENNPLLHTLEGFNKLQSIGELQILFNQNLEDIVGFQALRVVEKNLSILSNLALKPNSKDAFENLRNIQGDLVLLNNAGMYGLPAFSELESIGNNLLIQDNPSLIKLDALNKLKRVAGDVIIERNVSLTNIQGLKALESLGGQLRVRNNTLLESCCTQLNTLLMASSGRFEIEQNANGCSERDLNSCVLGISDIRQISPSLRLSNISNPVQHYLSLQIDSPTYISLYTLAGDPLLHVHVSRPYTLATEHLAQGVYVLQLVNDRQRFTQRIVKQ